MIKDLSISKHTSISREIRENLSISATVINDKINLNINTKNECFDIEEVRAIQETINTIVSEFDKAHPVGDGVVGE